jgi:hypothetical protein
MGLFGNYLMPEHLNFLRDLARKKSPLRSSNSVGCLVMQSIAVSVWGVREASR